MQTSVVILQSQIVFPSFSPLPWVGRVDANPILLHCLNGLQPINSSGGGDGTLRTLYQRCKICPEIACRKAHYLGAEPWHVQDFVTQSPYVSSTPICVGVILVFSKGINPWVIPCLASLWPVSIKYHSQPACYEMKNIGKNGKINPKLEYFIASLRYTSDTTLKRTEELRLMNCGLNGLSSP